MSTRILRDFITPNSRLTQSETLSNMRYALVDSGATWKLSWFPVPYVHGTQRSSWLSLQMFYDAAWPSAGAVLTTHVGMMKAKTYWLW